MGDQECATGALVACIYAHQGAQETNASSIEHSNIVDCIDCATTEAIQLPDQDGVELAVACISEQPLDLGLSRFLFATQSLDVFTYRRPS